MRNLARSIAPSRSIYEAVTSQILDNLARGVVPWRKPWRDSPPPANARSKHPYRGVNLFLLSLSSYRDHRWITFHQARELGGMVRSGEHSTRVVFWKQWKVKDREDEEDHTKLKSIPLLRFYHVFNVEQCEGLKLPPLLFMSQAGPKTG